MIVGTTAPSDEAFAAASTVSERLAELAAIGRQAGGGITRLPWSDEEAGAVRLFSDWSRAAGANVVRDDFGNVFALRGDWQRRPGVMLGSHLDTVPNGGAYDGALGVVAGLSVLESWAEPAPLCVAAFRAEEATLSAFGRLGSSVYAGGLALKRAAEIASVDVGNDLCELPVADVALPAAYLELHVEQGPYLESTGLQLGAVTGIAGYTRARIEIAGRADHVGSTPMELRRDALVAAAELVLRIEQLGLDTADVASVGSLTVFPNAVGVIAERVELTSDMRSLADDDRAKAMEALREFASEITSKRGLAIRIEAVAEAPAVRFPELVVGAVERAGSALGLATTRMPSGANHDAGNLSARCPAGMVFVPSRDGRSHSPDEYTRPEDCCNGALVLGLAAAMLSRGADLGGERGD